jgi:tRNA-Thr(GGU) m(6)t(6)A37 methyltransferase TsaA
MEGAESGRGQEYGQQIDLRPIGIIRSPHRGSDVVPVQPVYARGCTGVAELRPDLEEALKDLDGFSHLHLIYCFHQAGEPASLVKPHLGNSLRGVLATRSPRRPNPIGLSVVRLIRREGTRLHLDELDILDGTPLLDIKPFIADVDNRSASCAGWLEPLRPEMPSLKRRSAQLRKAEKT